MQFFQEYASLYLASLVMWSFLMAFLYNLVKKSAMPNSDGVLMWMSLAIFLSYLLSDPLLSLSVGVDIIYSINGYIIWAISDFVILLIILIITRKSRVQKLPAKLYVIIGLTVNMLLFLAMHIDINVLMHYEHWWFWTFYSITVNVMDVMMIIALLTNKDFLGLLGCYRWGVETKQSA
ncbi:hypothetical protein [Pseudoalteromonas sp. KS88]|uniref:hypothetical protein n=1 Tax=Pseudoalteromonas sp. KS88 TaxID=2109918 RepID=UPI001436A01A|nr:hypothetical protein [Pseudoalteromonas sp. KS88]